MVKSSAKSGYKKDIPEEYENDISTETGIRFR